MWEERPGGWLVRTKACGCGLVEGTTAGLQEVQCTSKTYNPIALIGDSFVVTKAMVNLGHQRDHIETGQQRLLASQVAAPQIFV